MGEVGAAAALVLACVFAIASFSKLIRPAATAASFAALRLPRPRELAVTVPVVEAVLALSLVVVPEFAGWVAVALLAAFSAVLARAVVTRSSAPCACFGSSGSEPVSSTELVRNVLLAALAVIASGRAGGVVPSLPALVLTTTAFALGRVALGLLDLRRHVGNVWSTPLPGEPA